MSTRNLPVGKGRPALKAENLIDCSDNMGASTSHSPMAYGSFVPLHGFKNARWMVSTRKT
jgi:hypothetical protein